MTARRKKNALERALIEVSELVRPVFADPRVFDRFRRLAFGLLSLEGRRTITALMQATGRSDCDWSADYRFFSRDVWDPTQLFSHLLPAILALYPLPLTTVVASLDDTNVRKTGTHIPGVSYRRDPMSPPFQANLIRAQRFLQTSIAVPFAQVCSAARAIPVCFDHAPSAGKLPKQATDEQRKAHREREKAQSLSAYALRAIERLRADLDRTAAHAPRSLLMAVDGSYTNKNVLTHLPAHTHLIGRIRKDAVLHDLPSAQGEMRGRPRSYGSLIRTPDQVRQDDSLPWTSIKIFGAGRHHACDIKEARPLLWRTTGPNLQLRLIVVRPLAYRPSKHARLLYRQPAYLITTDLDTSVEALVQAYFWRWDIEVNHRDEKQLIGVGHAQVRTPRSAERAPAFAVACYSMVLLAAARTYGVAAAQPLTERPKWLRRCSRQQPRLSTTQILTRLRQDLSRHCTPDPMPNFDRFASDLERHLKSPKGSISSSDAVRFALH